MERRLARDGPRGRAGCGGGDEADADAESYAGEPPVAGGGKGGELALVG